jgi:hypothetical protein
MPLLVGDEIYTLSKNDIKELKALYGIGSDVRGIIRVKYDKKHIRKSESKDSRGFIKPRSISISPVVRNVAVPIRNKNMANLSVEVRYYESRQPHPDIKGEFEYYPALLEIDHNKIIFNDVGLTGDKEANAELLWFLHYCSPNCKSGENFNPDMSMTFYIDNPKREADEKEKERKDAFKIQKLLFDDENALSDINLRLAAKVMMLDNDVDTYPAILRDKIYDALNHPVHGREYKRQFLDFVTNSHNGKGVVSMQNKVRLMVMEALQMRVIQHLASTHEYVWSLANGSPGHRICVVKNVFDNNAMMLELVDHFLINDGDRAILEREFPNIENELSGGVNSESASPAKKVK